MTLISFAPPTLQPTQQTSISVLPPTGTTSNVTASLVYDVYKTSSEFVSGAANVVSLIYQALGGPVLDLEITTSSVYVNFERAVLEYSRLVNNWQARNAIGSMLGGVTGTFNNSGELDNLPSGSVLSGALNPALTYPMFTFTYARTVQEGLAIKAGIGGNIPHYSASINLTQSVQDYDLEQVISASATDPNSEFFGRHSGRIVVTKVFYRSLGATWRFFGYYGGLNVVGNLNTYGQYSDDSTFEVIPIWQNKLQAQQFETNLWTRTSHYSYEIFNNKIRLFPVPTDDLTHRLWFQFYFEDDLNDGNIIGPNGRMSSGSVNINRHGGGVNNANTLPFPNIPFENINSMGQQWIREYTIALCKETLSLIRGKLGSIPIPGNEITLNYADLYSQAQDDKQRLREELDKMLDDTSYQSIIARDNEIAENTKNLANNAPMFFYLK